MMTGNKQPQQSRTTRPAGFTLIEMLVVIVIIAILAAILFPVFASARENARRTSCASNLKQIALGIAQYVQDNNGRYPLDGSAIDPSNVTGWAYTIQPYLKNEEIFQCPSEDGDPPEAPTLAERAVKVGFTDYYYNFNLGSGRKESVVRFPASTVLNGEGSSGPGSAANYSRARLGNFDGGPRRHLEGSNYAFADGHIKWLKPQEILSGNDPTTCNGGENAPNGSNATFCIY